MDFPCKRFVPGLAVLAGLGLGYPNTLFSLPLLVLLYPLGLALTGLQAASGKKAFLRAWLWAALGHVLALYWLSVPMSRVGGLPLFVAAPLAVLVCVVLATQGGLFALAARSFWKPEQPSSVLILTLVWYFLEYAYALVAGFPWLPLAGALAPWPWTLQIADTLGATLAGALWAGCAVSLASAVLVRRWPLAIPGLVVALGISGYGVWQLEQHRAAEFIGPDRVQEVLPGSKPDPDTFPVLLVEGNIDQNTKWVESFRQATVKTYVDLTMAALERARQAGTPANYLAQGFILWPETAMPFDLAHSSHTRSLMALAITARMPLLTGAPGTALAGGQRHVYNRVWLLDANGFPAGSYDKEHLVPFGEYVPSFFRWSFLEGLLQEVGAYTPGTRIAPMDINHLSIGALVCYEAVFPWLAQERVAQGANVLVDVSNDGWFGDTSAPHQHLALTGLRALEQNRWLVRCTNTGISAVFDNRGRLVLAGGQFQAQAIWAQARAENTPSLFHHIFWLLPPVCGLVLLLLVFWQRQSRSGQDIFSS